jgi:hypothetical protein
VDNGARWADDDEWQGVPAEDSSDSGMSSSECSAPPAFVARPRNPAAVLFRRQFE